MLSCAASRSDPGVIALDAVAAGEARGGDRNGPMSTYGDGALEWPLSFDRG